MHMNNRVENSETPLSLPGTIMAFNNQIMRDNGAKGVNIIGINSSPAKQGQMAPDHHQATVSKNGVYQTYKRCQVCSPCARMQPTHRSVTDNGQYSDVQSTHPHNVNHTHTLLHHCSFFFSTP